MAYGFAPAPAMQDGALFLGLRDDMHRAGIVTPRHLITVAGARSGKGAALIIPNLRTWSAGSVLVVDPKGENAEQTWQQREAMGHKVYVVDPFMVANVPDRLRASFNPLDAILATEQARTAQGRPSVAREDIRVLSDGLVMRYKADDATWDNGAVTVIAGMIAHNLSTAPEEYRTLSHVRAVLRMPEDALKPVFEDMAENPAFGGLAQAAASVGLSSAKSSREFVKGAQDQTEWLDADPMRATLARSDFTLSELKGGQAAVYLVLPPEYLGEHGRFLRLFVRCAINAMAQGGQGGGKCLFVLDEFFSLGRIDEIAKAAGLMPSYGVHLWPFLQDLGQLVQLYGNEGAGTFFGNADAHIFFGNTDPYTLSHISERLGSVSADEIGPPPVSSAGLPSGNGEFTRYMFTGGKRDPAMEGFAAGVNSLNAAGRAFGEMIERNEMAKYQHKAQTLGRPRLAPEEVRELVARHTGDSVARSMIAFATGGAVYNLRLHPYFLPDPVPPPPPPSLYERLERLGSKAVLGISGALSLWGVIIADSAPPLGMLALFFGVGGGVTGLLIRQKEQNAKALALKARDNPASETSPPPP